MKVKSICQTLKNYFRLKKSDIIMSRIAGRISKRMFLIYFGIYFLILLALFLIITPILYKEGFQTATSNLSVMKDEYSMLQDQLSGSITNLYLSDRLNTLLREYEKEPSTSTAARITQELSEYTTKNTNLLITCVETEYGDFFSSYYFPLFDTKEFLQNNANYMHVASSSRGFYFSAVNTSNLNTSDRTYKLISYTEKVSVGIRTYIVTTFYDVSSIIERCDTLNASVFTGYTITDRYGEAIYTTTDFTNSTSEEENPTNPKTALTGHKKNTKGIYFYNTIPSTGWVITAYTPYLKLFSTLSVIMGIITGLYLISPVLYILFLIPTIQIQLDPLCALTNTMSSFSAGEHVQSMIATHDEIEDLSNVFNKMVLKINQQIEDIKEQVQINSIVNYKLLATQIDPHFVYNTMNIINIMARQKNTEAIIEMNSALSRILRERLNSKLLIYTTVQNELDTLQQYELIMSYRYHNNVTINYSVVPTVFQHKIPRNLLQPLVENSYYHGFTKEESMMDGNVDVLIYPIENELILEVSDNGYGMSEERLNQLRNSDYSIYKDQKPHIGIDNVCQRLSYIYGKQFQFEIHSTLGLGTTIIITIPALVQEAEVD